MVCIHTENQNQGDLYPFVLLEISVLNESSLGHLHYLLTDVLPVKIAEGGLNFYLPLSFLFYFLFHFRSIFLFLELWIGLSDKDHTVT